MRGRGFLRRISMIIHLQNAFFAVPFVHARSNTCRTAGTFNQIYSRVKFSKIVFHSKPDGIEKRWFEKAVKNNVKSFFQLFVILQENIS